MIKAVIFDMDGVVADTEQINYMADQKVLKSAGINITKQEYEPFTGMPARQIYRFLLTKNSITSDIPKMLERRDDEIKIALKKTGLKPSPGFKELVGKLRSSGYKVGLASSSSLTKIKSVIDALRIVDVFTVIVSGWDVPANKPAPDIYLEAVRSLNLNIDECLAVEDSETGVRSAKSAGLKCIAIRTKHTKSQDISEADLIVKTLKEIKVKDLDNIHKQYK